MTDLSRTFDALVIKTRHRLAPAIRRRIGALRALGVRVHTTGDPGPSDTADGPAGRALVLDADSEDVRRVLDDQVRRRRHGRVPDVDDVIGPDEYHESVCDNVFTNVMARWNLRAAADVAASPAEALAWRRLAESMTAYNPMSYHNGSVWPHDNALCAAGLMRYGFVEEAQRVATAVLDAAVHFGHRLPELFCGFSRTDFDVRVPYPTSCSPQAWAAAAPLLLLRTLLRFDPRLDSGSLRLAPAVPQRYLPLRVRGLSVGEHRVDVEVGAGGGWLTGLEDTGVEVLS